MRRSPEELFARLRKNRTNNRKHRIAVNIVVIVFALVYQAFGWWLLNDMVRSLVPKEGADFAFHAVLSLPIVVGIAGLYPMLLFTGLAAVFAVFWLIQELYLCTKDDMLIHLLDRIEALEKSRRNTAGVDQSEESKRERESTT